MKDPHVLGDVGEDGGARKLPVARSVLYLASPAANPINGVSLISDFGYLARSGYPA